MENKKLIVLLSVLAVIFGLGFVGMVIYSMGLKNGKNIVNQGGAPNAPGSEVSMPQSVNSVDSMYVAEKEKQPEIMTGKIDSIDGEKLVLKQIASIDIKYEIKKEDVSSIVVMAKNPNFNEEKAKKAQGEMVKLMPPTTESPSPDQMNGNANGAVERKELSDDVKKKLKEFQEDPELRMFDEKTSSWESLQSGMQANLITEDGKKKLTVFPEEFPMGSVE